MYMPHFLDKHGYDPDKLFDDIASEAEDYYIPREKLTFSIYGKEMQLPRDKCFFGDQGKNGETPLYRYGGKYNPKVNDWIPTVKLVRDLVEKETGQHCNHCVLNRYVDGSDYIGFHRDKTKDIVDGSLIMTVSFGVTRVMKLKNMEDKKVISHSLNPGSLFSIGWKTNEEYKHSIPKSAKIKGTRISLTLRSIKTTQKPEKE